MATQTVVRQRILDMLDALDFNEYTKKKHPNLHLTVASFDKLLPEQFRVIFYYLFNKVSGEETRRRFRSVYPAKDRNQEAEFRQITIKWLEELAEKDGRCRLGRILPIYFQRLSGSPFIDLVFRFTLYVVSRIVGKQNVQQQVRETLGPWKDLTELAERVNAFAQQQDEEEAELADYLARVEEKTAKMAQAREAIESDPISVLFPDVSGEFLEASNAELSRELAEITEFLDEIIVNLKDHAKLSSTGGRLEGRDSSLIAELEQIDELVKAFKRYPEKYLTALKSAAAYRRTMERFTKLVDDSAEVVDELKERLAILKGELFATEEAKKSRAFVLEHFKTFLEETPLSFRAYGTVGQALDRVLSEGPGNEVEAIESN